MREGYSWSGHEENVCFLNTNGNGFADASSVSNFAWPDDSRGLAMVDWDHDGDLDLWLTNRTAPMVRYLQNETSSSSSLSVSLQGVDSNRDAIGARAILTLQSGRQMTRSVRAGEGYLSQSSKRLHFAWLGNDTATSLQILWPNGKKTTHAMSENKQRLHITEEATITVEPPNARRLSESPNHINRSVRRTVSVSRPWFPHTELGNELVLGTPRKHPLLVQLGASWCAPCLKERRAFAQAERSLRAAKIDLLSISVDGISKDNFPFPQVASTPAFLEAMEVIQRSLFDRSEPIALPLSFLLDPAGRLICLYSGPVSPEQVIEDRKLISSSSGPLPFSGQWLESPQPMDLMKIALSYFAAGKKDRALAYLNQLVASGIASADLHAFRASLLKGDAQIKAYEMALKLDSKHVSALRALAAHFLKQRDVNRAQSFIDRLLVLQPYDSEGLFSLAQIQFATGKLEEAIATMRLLAQHHPDHFTAINNLAWILATHPNDQLRNGSEALELARRLPLNAESTYADTLAAALAETGAFKEALDVLAKWLPSGAPERKRAYESRRSWIDKR